MTSSTPFVRRLQRHGLVFADRCLRRASSDTLLAYLPQEDAEVVVHALDRGLTLEHALRAPTASRLRAITFREVA